MISVDLMHGDCLSLMKSIPTGAIDLILCDLPYGVTKNKLDVPLPFNLLWEQYNRILKPDGACVLFGQGLFFVDLVNSNRADYRYDIVWDKQLTSGFLNAKRRPLRQHENIAVFYKRLGTFNPQMHTGNPLHGRGSAYKVKKMVNQNYGDFSAVDDLRKGSTSKYPTSIVRCCKPHPSVAVHRTEKPIQLLSYLIKTYSNPGEKVLDNCMGSGSTGLACIETGRSFIGIEIDGSTFELAQRRISEALIKAGDANAVPT